MRLYERFADKGYHTSVATTFGIDFDAYENIVLPRLRGAGCRNNMVVTDSRMLTHALGGASDLPQLAGTRYTVSGASATGVFHPKLFLQFGRRGGRLIVGSANLTPSGLAGNLELVSTTSCNQTNTGEQQLIAQAWDYVSRFIDDHRQSVADQRHWMQARTSWLSTATPATGPVHLTDGTLAALLTTGPTAGIAERFADLVDEPVSRLILISPYWDPNLAALSYLAERLGPTDISALIDPETREFPKDAANSISGLKLYIREKFHEGRFIHAKAIIAQTETADHMLLGSANCTRAALGGSGTAGVNEEVSLYRRLPSGAVLDTLGLSTVLQEEHVIQRDELEAPEFTDDLPLGELGKHSPGQFECRGDTLLWHPVAIDDTGACAITLLDHKAREISCVLKSLRSSNGSSVRYQINGTEQRPVFARVAFPDGSESPPAIVTRVDELKMEIREARRSSIQSKLDDLESETEASLALLEVLNELENLERGETTPKEPLSIPRVSKDETDASDASRHRTLSYEDFVAGRRPRASGSEASYNSLAGSDVSFVRGILNRIIGLQGNDDHHKENDDGDKHEGAFDLGDETDDPEGALAAGGEFGTQDTGSDDQQPEEDKQRRRASQRRATQEQLVKAVGQFQTYVKEQQANGSALTNYDLVRLRVLLMILATTASPKRRSAESAKEQGSRLRVLPIEGDHDSWPMVMGRLLFVFFGGKNPAIRQLHLANEHDQVPGDFNECWGTCYWCFQACFQAPFSKAERTRILSLLKPVARTSFLLTLPSKDEVLADNIISVMDRMSESYAKEMHIDPAAIRNGHRALVEEIFSGPHLNGMGGVVSPDAVDAADGKPVIGPLDRQAGLCRRLDYEIGHSVSPLILRGFRPCIWRFSAVPRNNRPVAQGRREIRR